AGVGSSDRESRRARGELHLHADAAGTERLVVRGLGPRTDAVAARPGGLGPLLKLAVELEVDLLVEEAEQALDASDLRKRIGVVPDEVLGPVHRVVAGRPFVRAARDLVARLELGDDVLRRDVPAGRQV